jgi:uncharacterized protein (DUF2147 family)
MKLLLSWYLLVVFAPAQSGIVGRWKTIDDSTGEDRSIVEVEERNGKLSGRIVSLIDPEEPNPICDRCDTQDKRYNKPIIGMEIIRDMERSGQAYEGGTILDPEDGRVYRCRIWLEGSELKVRGYWGPFFRTQTWRKST